MQPPSASDGPTVLDLLAARSWRDDGVVRAMPVVLRIEKRDPPARTPLLEAAAAAAVAVCLDERSAPGGEWYDEVTAWVRGPIRKLARRARAAHWTAVGDLPGVTVEVGGAQARALLPGPVDAVDPRVDRLQITGTDLPPDEPGPPAPGVPLLLLNPDATMTTGKAAAQVGHATMLLAAALRDDPRLAAWRAAGWRCAVRTATAWPPRDALAVVRDGGFTEVAPGTATVAALWP